MRYWHLFLISANKSVETWIDTWLLIIVKIFEILDYNAHFVEKNMFFIINLKQEVLDLMFFSKFGEPQKTY